MRGTPWLARVTGETTTERPAATATVNRARAATETSEAMSLVADAMTGDSPTVVDVAARLARGTTRAPRAAATRGAETTRSAAGAPTAIDAMTGATVTSTTGRAVPPRRIANPVASRTDRTAAEQAHRGATTATEMTVRLARTARTGRPATIVTGAPMAGAPMTAAAATARTATGRPATVATGRAGLAAIVPAVARATARRGAATVGRIAAPATAPTAVTARAAARTARAAARPRRPQLLQRPPRLVR